MNAPLVRLAAIIVLALPATSRADEEGKAGEKTKLVTRVYRLRASDFFRGDPAGLNVENPPFGFKKLPPTADGEMRYDMWEILTFGREKIPGSAILLAASDAVVLTGSPEMQEWFEKMYLPDHCGEVHAVEITVSLWEYEDAWFPDPGVETGRFADLRKRAGDSLRPLDSQSILTKSGQRAFAVNREAGAAPAPGAAQDSKPENAPKTELERWAQLNGARGSYLAVEPTIGPNGKLVDFSIEYHARLKRACAARDLEIEVTTSVTVSDNHDSIPYSVLVNDDPRPVQAGKVRRRALVVGVRVINEHELARQERDKEREQEDKQFIRKARSGLGVSGK